MPISECDVRRAAAAARLALDDRDVATLAQEIDDLLGAARLVRKARTADTPRVSGIGAGGMPLRAYAVARPLDEVRPDLRDGRRTSPPLAAHPYAVADGPGSGGA